MSPSTAPVTRPGSARRRADPARAPGRGARRRVPPRDHRPADPDHPAGPLHHGEQWFTLRFRATKADCSLVVVETGDGLTGVGEACAYDNPREIVECVEWLAPSLVGRTVDDAFRLAQPTGTSWAYDCAVAGVDCALWDVRGKLAGLRVCNLLAGDAPADVELYASGGCRYDWAGDPCTLIEEVLGYAERGFRT